MESNDGKTKLEKDFVRLNPLQGYRTYSYLF